MTDLVEFLRARLDEDDQAAQDAFSGQADPENGWGAHRPEWQRHTTITPHVGIIHESLQADHIIRWNPARVLREVEAKRKIIEDFTYWQPHDPGFDALEPAIQFLALPYADHPDYREEWRP